jgi:hypothetical protein
MKFIAVARINKYGATQIKFFEKPIVDKLLLRPKNYKHKPVLIVNKRL